MSRELSPGKPTRVGTHLRRRIRLFVLCFSFVGSWVRSRGRSNRIADQLGYGAESLRRWVEQAEIDSGQAPGISTADREKFKKLEQENRELRQAERDLEEGFG